MPSVFLKQGVGQGLYYDIGPEPTVIGRSRGCTIELGGLGISRTHASIRLGPGQEAVLEDMGSKNGTFLNGKRIERAILKDGDEITIGPALFVYRDDRADKGSPLQPSEKSVKSTVRSVLNVGAMEKVDSGDVPTDIELLRKSHKYLAIVCRVGRSVSTTLNLGELLNSIIDIVFEEISPDEAFIMLKDDASGELSLRLFRSKLAGSSEEDVAISRTILDKVLREGVAVLSADASADTRFKAADSVLRYNLMSTMCIPLMSKEGVLGVLHVSNRESSGEFGEEDLQLLAGIANQAALAIENAKLHHNIQLEACRRNNLQRYLSPNAVEQIIDGTKELSLGGEVKEVTVLFSDIRDFTRLSEELPPDEVVEKLNEYFSEMTRIAFKHEGAVDKFIGDALIVVYGAAIPHMDDAQRAVKTGIEMQSAMRELNARWEEQGRRTFQIGIGINTGTVLYGNVGSEQRMELTVIGDAVNMASRLAEVAGGGEILLSGVTHEALQGQIPSERMHSIRIRGKKKGIQIYRLR